MSKAKGVVQGQFGRAALLDIDRPIAAHAHPHCHVLIKVSGADSLFRVDGRDYPLLDDTAVVVNAWEPHAYPHAVSDTRSAILALYIETDWLQGVDRRFGVSRSAEFFARPCFPLPMAVRRMADETAAALTVGEGEGRVFGDLLLGLMIQVIENFSQWRQLRGRRPPADLRVSDFRIRRALGLLRDNVGNGFPLESVARMAGLSRAHFFELFRQQTGMTPNLYYNALRMEAAYEALPEPGVAMGSISSHLGFSSQSHFSRFFRSHLGVPPSQYRRILRLA